MYCGGFLHRGQGKIFPSLVLGYQWQGQGKMLREIESLKSTSMCVCGRCGAEERGGESGFFLKAQGDKETAILEFNQYLYLS